MNEFAIPADYDEFFRRYRHVIVHYIIKGKIPYERVDDVTSEILAALMKKDILGTYRPESPQGESRSVRFDTFLIAIVQTYVRGHRDKGHRYARREVLSRGDAGSILEVVDWQLDPAGQSWAYRMMVDQVRAHLVSVPRKSPKDSCDLAKLFESIVRQVEETGRKDTVALMAEFGIGRSSLWKWMARLRSEMAVILNPA